MQLSNQDFVMIFGLMEGMFTVMLSIVGFQPGVMISGVKLGLFFPFSTITIVAEAIGSGFRRAAACMSRSFLMPMTLMTQGLQVENWRMLHATEEDELRNGGFRPVVSAETRRKVKKIWVQKEVDVS